MILTQYEIQHDKYAFRGIAEPLDALTIAWLLVKADPWHKALRL